MASDKAARPFGHLFTNWKKEPCKLTPWPQPDWRPVEDGVSGGTTEGSFSLSWKNGAHYATNSGVANGDYCFAYTTLNAALTGKAEKSKTGSPPSSCFCCTEINYHACGAQLFYCDNADVVVVVAKPPPARAPDNILPEDFRAIYLPKGVGMCADANVWHCPPIAVGPKAVMVTKQAAVHSKIYYYPLKEHSAVLKIPLKF